MFYLSVRKGIATSHQTAKLIEELTFWQGMDFLHLSDMKVLCLQTLAWDQEYNLQACLYAAYGVVTINLHVSLC